MAKNEISLKRIAVSKANKQMVIIAAVGAFITVFCLVASNYLLGIQSYQAKIIAADISADNKLKSDVSAKNQLVQSYEKFIQKNPTITGAKTTNSPYKYNNATVILDALPSQYDFPALTTSIDKLLQSNNLSITSIGGTDQSATISNSPSSNPQPVAMPFSFAIDNANYQSVQTLFVKMQESIRPLQINNINLTGTDSNMTLTVNAHTYFQPKKVFKIGTETITP